MSRLQSLERAHSELDSQIRSFSQLPGTDPMELKQLKRKKLHLKDEIEIFRRRSGGNQVGAH